MRIAPSQSTSKRDQFATSSTSYLLGYLTSVAHHFFAYTIRFKQAKEEKFPIGITPATFARAKAYTTRLQYSGPLALSCDDTKLLEGFRLYQSDDGTGQQKWFITGSTDDSPREVANIEELEEVLATGELQKASKVRRQSEVL